MTRGVCPVCGTNMAKMGKTPEHEGLEKPVIEKTAAAKKTKTSKTSKSAKSAKITKKSSSAKKLPAVHINKNQSLVIVESPAKAKTVGRFLGKDYVVRASIGHVRDLNKYTMSIDLDHDFTPKYYVPKEKKELVQELTALAAGAKKVYLATDPDREGEAIAWHLQESADIDPKKTERVVFHEITEPAINDAFAHPGKVNMDLVDAQQARRVLDRIVGYSLSPLLMKKVHMRNLSAGRVQSVALKLVVDREREIQNFVPREYWTIKAELTPDGIKDSYIAQLAKINKKDPELGNEKQVNEHLTNLKAADYKILSLKEGEKKRRPYPPFTTSTLQQEASRRLGFSSKKTMMLAQQLYEGLSVGAEGSVGLITYMRTDSTNISPVAQNEARDYITSVHGKSFVPAKPPLYTKKAKGAQEAHEAVRPTSVMRSPDKIKEYLEKDQYRLYQLIWQRFLASQMADAVYKTETVEVEANKVNSYLFRASGQKVIFPGFLVVYADIKDEDSKEEEVNTIFPNGLKEGQKQNLKKLIPDQHFTQPPARYTEATLVRAMEENGIGRPSTYASIISTIEGRNYVNLEKRHLVPSETGFMVNDLLVGHFDEIMDIGFTSQMENELDSIAEGEKEWVEVIRQFYDTFEPELEKAKENMPEIPKAAPEPVGRDCPDCGKPLVYRTGRFGKFISCSGYPDCRYTEKLQKPVEKIGVACPKCGGDLIVKRTHRGKIFYGCVNYPTCDFAEWNRPISQKCPLCGSMMVMSGKDSAVCTNKDCQHKIHIEADSAKE
ncbi:MAG: type I DNA topoisomerase [Anaerolineaceae bacterium]|nr:type I DNA topoisomerase [Anaerolineaceae bacterium]